MRRLLKGIFWAATFFTCVDTFAQAEDSDVEIYLKENTAFTNLKGLGVNKAQYAQCVESVNYLEPAKKARVLVVDKVEYRDDGLLYDLISGDGILTSTMLFNYAAGETPITPGQYVNNKENVLVIDPAFAFRSATGKWPHLEIVCDFYFERCSSLTEPARSICNSFGFPFGNWVLKNCKVKFVLF
jgi:hypothetical protein